MRCCSHSTIVTLSSKLFIEVVVSIVFFIEVKTKNLTVPIYVEMSLTHKCKQGVTVGLDDLEIRGVVELKPDFLPQFKQMEIVKATELEPLCTMRLKSGKCVSQPHGNYNCSCSANPPKYNVVFRSTIVLSITEIRDSKLFIWPMYIRVWDKGNLSRSVSYQDSNDKLIPKPSFSLEIDNKKSNLLSCFIESEVGTVHEFTFCTEHLYLPIITMSPDADKANASCATKNVAVQSGETKLRMSYEDHCDRKDTYTCTITAKPSFSLEIDNIKSNLLSCSITSEVGTVHEFTFCTEHLYLPIITMSPMADESNASCATKKVASQSGETKLRMSYEDHFERKDTYTCTITGFTHETVMPTMPPEGDTSPIHTTNTSSTKNFTNQAPRILVRTYQSIMFTVVTILILCVTTFAVIAFLFYTTVPKEDDDSSDYSYSSSGSSSNS